MTMTQSKKTDVVFIRGNPDDLYFTVIEQPGPTVVVLGEADEQWTSMTISYLEKNAVTVEFLPWAHLHNVRLALEVTQYPIVQCWVGGKMRREVVGYQAEGLRQLVDDYFHLKSARGTGDKYGKEEKGRATD
jgi:hypothetical protein